MSENTISDGELLWKDLLNLVQINNKNPSFVAMLKSSTVKSFEGDILTIATGHFAKRKICENKEDLESYLQEIAFQPIHLVVNAEALNCESLKTNNTVSQSELEALKQAQTSITQVQSVSVNNFSTSRPVQQTEGVNNIASTIEDRKRRNKLIETIETNDSKLTFERFVEGENNKFALQSAKQVANGSTNYRTIFIFGKSGLGKTHLLRAIQNYINQNDDKRLALYKTAKDFQNDYVTAFNNSEFSAQEALRQNYIDIDVLIIDDIQNLTGTSTINFFFETFNYLSDHGKWIVVAADRTPNELGLGEKGLDERVVSRISGGLVIPISIPSDEFKYKLIKNFYERLKEDSEAERMKGYEGTISEENLKYMAEKCGNNIRTISGFCQECLVRATQNEHEGKVFNFDEINKIARSRWNPKKKEITISMIKKAVSAEFDIDVKSIISNSRKKDIALARHTVCLLSRELTDLTLAEIGEHLGGRSHATVVSSISVSEENLKKDRLFKDRFLRIKEQLDEESFE